MSTEKYLDLPGAENSLAYQYAKNFLNWAKSSGGMERSPVETNASVYESLNASLQESEISYLITESQEAQVAWDSLNQIAQDLLREGKLLPPELAEWVADVLADQWVEEKRKKERRRRRPPKGARSQQNRDRQLCVLVSQLVCLFNLSAIRGYEDPPESACDVVAAAMGKSHKTVEKIWGNREPDLENLYSSWDKRQLMKSPFYPQKNPF